MSLPASSSSTATKAKPDNDPTKPAVSNPAKITTNLVGSLPASSPTATMKAKTYNDPTYSAVSNLAKVTTNSAMSLPASSSTNATKAKPDNEPTEPAVSNPANETTILAASTLVSSLTALIKFKSVTDQCSIFVKAFKCVYTNATSLNPSKISDLSSYVSIVQPDLLFISETRFSPKSCPHLDGYDVNRRDRNGFHGGVAIYVSRAIKFSEVEVNQAKHFTNQDCEQLWLTITYWIRKNHCWLYIQTTTIPIL